ncbi:HK97 gp10 family phage protein [Methylobacterium persicinum]|uniref:Uncharacterized protein n=1 Tax=Methylobacterium persicinum TaxID=374426 RepID=A0ABU0HQS1_9HYPH|nr:HK97 gp10 family phage protein [Methylobacterium persicinum]MDQ0444660.1 hypothetical protein [Methylobacterium persicinum]GJE38561.1 hypothetical protein KHHGKMAE_2634 [Methylobacterium persicinum]
MSLDLGDLAAGAGRVQSALDITPAARAFRRAPGVLPGLRLLDAAADIVGLERLSGQIAKYAVKLALRGDHAAEAAAARMVETMRGRVPVDTGRLLHGIGWRRDGSLITVEASAIHGAADYARHVEFGHRTAVVADAAFFAADTHAALHARGAAGAGAVAAEPFFWDAVREGLALWRDGLADAPATVWTEGEP